MKSDIVAHNHRAVSITQSDYYISVETTVKATKMKAYLALLFLVYFVMPGLCRSLGEAVRLSLTLVLTSQILNTAMKVFLSLVLMSTMMISAGLL